MFRKSFRALVAGAALIGVAHLASGSAHAVQSDLFANYYVGPSVYGGVPAQMYVSPQPAPPHVGHTYITYQPLMPHEFTYRHHRTYYRYYPGGFHNVTKVYWW